MIRRRRPIAPIRDDAADAAIATKALLCSRFHIAWADYELLTLREQRVLIGLLNDVHDAAEAAT